jgi:hypothetical protein
MVGPHRAVAPAQPVEEHVGRTIAAVQRGVQRELQARGETEVVGVLRPFASRDSRVLGRGQRAGEQLAFGAQVLDREHERVLRVQVSSESMALPALRYLSADSYAVESLARRPAIRFQRRDALALVGVADEMRAAVSAG